MRRLALLALLALPAAAPAATQPKPVIGTEIAWLKAFDVMLWDSVNGTTRISDGYDPALSADGHFLVYLQKTSSACRKLHLLDTRTRKEVAVPDVNRGQCISDPTLSGDGRLLAWTGDGKTEGDPWSLYLYDTVTKHELTLGAPVESTSSEQWPALSQDGKVLAFVSGRDGFDQVFLADISQVPTGGAATLLPTPGLPVPDGPSAAQREAAISGNGNRIAFVTGPDLGRKVNLYDRTTHVSDPLTSINSGEDIYNPALNQTGATMVVARLAPGTLVSNLWSLTVGGAFNRLAGLSSTVGDEGPAIASPVVLLDRTPPKVKFSCKAKGHRKVVCTVTTNEAGHATVQVRGKRPRIVFAKAGTKKVTIRGLRPGKAKAVARVYDLAGNVKRVKRSVKIKP